MLILWMVFSACSLPVAPGCGGLASPVRDDEMLVSLVLVRNDPDLAGVAVDLRGNTELHAAWTEWMLGPARVCNHVPPDGLERIEGAWSGLTEGMDYGEWYRLGREPFLWVTFHAGGESRSFFVTPGEPPSTGEIASATATTLQVLVEVYGDRFVRELRGAGLESLAAPAFLRGE